MPRQTEHRVAALVVELKVLIFDALRVRDVVVLRNAHLAAHEVARSGARVQAELARVDDAEPAVRGQVGALREALLPVGPVGEVVGALGRHRKLRGELAVTQEERRRLRAPRLEVVLGILNKNIQRVGVLLHDTEEIGVLAARLRGRALLVVVLLLDVALVARRLEERDVHVEVIGHLDRAHELGELVLEVLAAGRGHHEVVLHRDGETLAHDVSGERLLALRQNARGRLVGNARGNALVKAIHIPLEFLVGVFKVFIRQNITGEGELVASVIRPSTRSVR